MKLFFVDACTPHLGIAERAALERKRPFRMLLSYHYYKNTDLDVMLPKHFAEPYPEIFIDSGAWSAFTMGVEIDYVAYVAWLKRYAHHITQYANLDSLKNVVRTRDNQKRMEDDGLRPIPAWHMGETYDDLAYYIDRGYEYIAIGGMVPYLRRAKQLMSTLIPAFQMAKAANVRLHGFGCTAWEVVRMLPWHSVDSSSWASGVRYGSVPIFDYAKGKFQTVQLRDRAAWHKVAPLVRSWGFDPEDFADGERFNRATTLALSAISYLEAARWLEKRHGTRPDGTPTSGRLFLTDGNAQFKDLKLAAPLAYRGAHAT